MSIQRCDNNFLRDIPITHSPRIGDEEVNGLVNFLHSPKTNYSKFQVIYIFFIKNTCDFLQFIPTSTKQIFRQVGRESTRREKEGDSLR